MFRSGTAFENLEQRLTYASQNLEAEPRAENAMKGFQ